MKSMKVTVVLFFVVACAPVQSAFAAAGRFQMLFIGESSIANRISKGAAQHFRKPVVFRIGSSLANKKPLLHQIFIQKLRMRNLPVVEVVGLDGNPVGVTSVKGFLDTIASVQKDHFLGVSESGIEQILVTSLEAGELLNVENLEEIRMNSALGETF